jgi:hypothetical protein
MQEAVLTFYGLVTTFILAAMTVLRPQSPNPNYYLWLAGIMIGIGFIGILVGYGLFRSRTMQCRTNLYLKTLLFQMVFNVKNIESIKNSAIRFRSLCSTQGHFKLWDTMNIAILIAFYSGEVLQLVGVLTMLVIGGVLCLNQAVVIGLVFLVLFVVLTPILIQHLMNKERDLMKKEYLDAAKEQNVEQILKRLELPKLVEPK